MLERGRGQLPWKRDPWPVLWHALCAAPLIAVVVVFFVGQASKQPLFLEPLLAVPPALAGIGATRARRPLLYGGVSLAAAIAVATRTYGATPSLPIATVVAVAAVTAVSAAGAVLSSRRNQKLAEVTTVAEVAQRALLRPLPSRVGPLELGVVYLAATAEARVGGDLYEVARTPYGIRLIMGDVRGKGLGAVEIAADILGVFREAAHDVYTLAEVARRLDASLTRREETPEEFVTAVLVEVDPDVTGLTIYNCGHPPPIVVRAAADGAHRQLIIADVPVPAPPLGLMSLGDCSAAGRKVAFSPGDELLLYTDGVTEARDSRRTFYPLAQRLAGLTRQTATADGSRPDLLELLRDDVLQYVGAPLDDDAAILHVRAVSVRRAMVHARGAQEPSGTAASPS